MVTWALGYHTEQRLSKRSGADRPGAVRRHAAHGRLGVERLFQANIPNQGQIVKGLPEALLDEWLADERNGRIRRLFGGA